MSWRAFFGWTIAGYVCFNAIFAGLYLLGGDCFGATHPGSVLEAFAFSVQTMSGIGYGAMSPTTPYAHVVSIVEAFAGLAGIAMVTGLLFSKFSRPVAKIGFADVVVVGSMHGQRTLEVRVSNTRRNQVVDARVQITALIDTVSPEGHDIRRLLDLDLVRSQTPVFALSWLVMHIIDEDSPLHGLTASNIDEQLSGLMVNIMGIDDTFTQTVHAQRLYGPGELRFDHRFVDMIERGEGGLLIVHHDRLHDIVPVTE